MQTTVVKNNVEHGLFNQVITPSERHNRIFFPKELYGKRVQVVFFPATTEKGMENDQPKPLRNTKPFIPPRHRVGTMRVSNNLVLLSENLIRADRDAR